MDRTEKIMGMLTLLELNDDQFCYEMTSLAAKINNFLDDRSRLLSGQWLSVMYKSLTEENDEDTVEIFENKPVEIEDTNKTVRTDIYESVEIDNDDIHDIVSPAFDDSHFVLV